MERKLSITVPTCDRAVHRRFGKFFQASSDRSCLEEIPARCGTADWLKHLSGSAVAFFESIPLSFLAAGLVVALDVQAPPRADAQTPAPRTLFNVLVPDNPNATDSGVPYELGTRFQPKVAGVVTGIRYFKASSETGNHRGSLWDDNGNLLGAVDFSAEQASGWQEQNLPNPIRVEAGQTYVVTVNANQYYAFSLSGLVYPGVVRDSLHTSTNEPAGIYGSPGSFPSTSYQNSNYFRDVVFAPDSGTVRTLEPFYRRGWLGWIRDLATEPAPADAYWPYLAVDDGLSADYEAAGTAIVNAGATEIEIWGLAAGGTLGSPGYLTDVESTASPQRIQQVTQIIRSLQAKGLKVVAGMGGLSWGFDQIVADPANADMRAPNSPYIANPLVQKSWDYQFRIVDYLFKTFGVDGITIQSADQGRCQDPQLDPLTDVQYHSTIVPRITAYLRNHYPGTIVGSANYGVAVNNSADLPDLKKLVAGSDYFNDVYDNIGSDYLPNLVAGLSPVQFGTEGNPTTNNPPHAGRETWFVPTFQRSLQRLQQAYTAGARACENYMRILANPSDEISGLLILNYEADPASDWGQNLDRLLNTLYQPQPDALGSLHNLFVDAENAYFNNAKSESVQVEAYFDYNDRGFPFLRNTNGNMTRQGRDSYRQALLSLQTTAQGLVSQVQNQGKMQSIVRCLTNTIAEIDDIDAQGD